MDKEKKIGVREILVSILAFAVLFVACSWIVPWVTVQTFHNEPWENFRPIDWKVYNDAMAQLIRGATPYTIPGAYQFYNPPWILLVILPFTFLPYPYNLALFMTIGFVVYLWVYSRFNSNLVATTFYLLSAPVVWGLIGGQIDWIILIGLLLPPQYGLFLVLAKPQVGCLIAVIWLIDAYKERRVVRTFAPVLVAFGLSFLIYGLWPLNWIGLVEAEPMIWWPYTLVLGVPLLGWALRTHNPRLALCASPILSPHSMLHSWCGSALIIAHPVVMGVFTVGTWVFLFTSNIQ